ncbi:bifunctional methylenetetrahydrofolate dehydrogenase/methenyltetrahydrofolate cyclohydrolase [Candidatus Falkowbacteria bacterium]|nr:bifunctional methylenetetrahydrofolate dehydrogenase/methenyltetrahydrofolate cyclohydrolase [Candidatus Falkowbacteria bacterium]
MKNNKKSAQILDGRTLAEKIKSDLHKKIARLKRRPGLAAILVGHDPASELYIRLKEKACQEAGINFYKYLCNQPGYPHIAEKELLKMINFLNQDERMDGILVQLPLPPGFKTQKIIEAIAKEKDVDGFNYPKVKIAPPVISAIIELLKSAPKPDYAHKNALIIIKNNRFAHGLEIQLKNLGLKNISREKKIPDNSNDYEVIIIALGAPRALKKSMIKKGAIIIDVGINKLGDKIVGDVEPKAAEAADYISPVPGGVGPLTVACLLRNTYILSKTHNK